MITKTDLIEQLGSAAELARAAGVSPQAVSKWGDLVPLSSVVAVSKATGHSLNDLRPDLFDPDPSLSSATT
jgi:hypothetical protein